MVEDSHAEPRQDKPSSYKSFEVYQLAHDLGVRLHALSLKLPKYELYETGSQLRRASKAISLLFVEGYGRRRYKADDIRYLDCAQATLDESREAVEYIRDCHPQLAEAANAFVAEIDILGRKLGNFIRRVERDHRSDK